MTLTYTWDVGSSNWRPLEIFVILSKCYARGRFERWLRSAPQSKP